MRTTLLWIVGGSIIAGLALGGWYVWQAQPDSADDVITDSSGEFDPTDIDGSTCALGTTYRRSAAHQSGCVCPAGYEFDSTVIGYNQCYGPGTECPILDVTCVLVPAE